MAEDHYYSRPENPRLFGKGQGAVLWRSGFFTALAILLLWFFPTKDNSVAGVLNDLPSASLKLKLIVGGALFALWLGGAVWCLYGFISLLADIIRKNVTTTVFLNRAAPHLLFSSTNSPALSREGRHPVWREINDVLMDTVLEQKKRQRKLVVQSSSLFSLIVLLFFGHPKAVAFIHSFSYAGLRTILLVSFFFLEVGAVLVLTGMLALTIREKINCG